MTTFLMALLLNTSFAGSYSASLESWKQATVKISSYPCLTQTPKFEGSGLLIEKQGRLYVLTSEHVIIHDQSSKTCHRTGNSNLQLIKVDYHMGLALLQISDNNSVLGQNAIRFAQLINPGPADSLIALGYPATSSEMNVLTSGKLNSETSGRALISGISQMIEASGLPVEYGMSGGLLLAKTSQGFELKGLLSHQILRRQAGRPTLAEDINAESGNTNDLTLAIPVNILKAWMTESLVHPETISWKRNPGAQIGGHEVLQYGVLLLSMKSEKIEEALGIGGFFPGILLGGSDGAGIGGNQNAENSPAEIFQIVNIQLAPEASAEDRSRPISEPQLEKWRQWLLSGKIVKVVSLKETQSRTLYRAGTLSQMMTYWLRDHYVPIALRSKDQIADTDTLQEYARTAARIAQRAREKSPFVHGQNWFALIRDYCLLAENLQMNARDIESLLSGENDPYWRDYYSQDFEAAVELESAVQKLIEKMKKIGL